MDVQLIARDPHALQQPVGIDMIQALCVRAFGSQTAIQSIHELGIEGHTWVGRKLHEITA